jgi:hypothetical protein
MDKQYCTTATLLRPVLIPTSVMKKASKILGTVWFFCLFLPACIISLVFNNWSAAVAWLTLAGTHLLLHWTRPDDKKERRISEDGGDGNNYVET